MLEVGVLTHERKHYAAYGATVVGRQVTGYTHNPDYQRRLKGYPKLSMVNCRDSDTVELKSWNGKVTLMSCRHEIVATYPYIENGISGKRDPACAIMWCLTKGHYIVGYAFGTHGTLFRGELIQTNCRKEAREICVETARYWIELDAEEQERFEAEEADE